MRTDTYRRGKVNKFSKRIKCILIKMNYKIKQIQFAIFPKNFDIENKLKIANDIKVKSEDVFNGEPFILPLPSDAPPEIPRVTLQSKDGNYVCNISPLRIDFIFKRPEEDKEYSDVKEKYLRIAKTISTYFSDDLKLSIGRIGFVTTFAINIKESPVEFLKKNTLEKSYYFSQSKKLKNITLAFSEYDTIGKWDVARVLKLDTLANSGNLEEIKKIQLQYDINTLRIKMGGYHLSESDIHELLNKMSEEIKEENFIKFLNTNI